MRSWEMKILDCIASENREEKRKERKKEEGNEDSMTPAFGKKKEILKVLKTRKPDLEAESSLSLSMKTGFSRAFEEKIG